MKTAALLLTATCVLAGLSGCATLNQVRMDVSTPAAAPPALVGAEVQLQAAPDNAASADAAGLQRAVVRAATAAGLKPVLGRSAPYTARYAFGSLVDLDASYALDGPYPLRHWRLPDGRWAGAPTGWWHPWLPPDPQYLLGFEIEIRDAASGALVWTSGSSTTSFASSPDRIASELAAAAFDGFPGARGNREVALPAQ